MLREAFSGSKRFLYQIGAWQQIHVYFTTRCTRIKKEGMRPRPGKQWPDIPNKSRKYFYVGKDNKKIIEILK
jgi:hypothetical protein